MLAPLKRCLDLKPEPDLGPIDLPKKSQIVKGQFSSGFIALSSIEPLPNSTRVIKRQENHAAIPIATLTSIPLDSPPISLRSTYSSLPTICPERSHLLDIKSHCSHSPPNHQALAAPSRTFCVTCL